jgi:uncharacterized protein YndB with AHSA1/START domain
MTDTDVLAHGFTLTRILDAPRELVFQAWTDPEQLQWFLNPGAATPEEPIEVDLRVGGEWKLLMVIDEDTQYYTGGVYREIVPVEKLAFTWGAADGWPKIDPDRSEDGPLVTLTFSDIAGSTEMVLQFTLPDHLSEDAVREWMGTPYMREGWGETIDRVVAKFAENN